MARTLSNVRTKISQSISLTRGGPDTPPRTAASVCPEPPPSTASRRLSLTSVPGGGGRTAAGGYLPDLYREGSPEKNWIDSLRSLDSGVAATSATTATGGGKQQVTKFQILQSLILPISNIFHLLIFQYLIYNVYQY